MQVRLRAAVSVQAVAASVAAASLDVATAAATAAVVGNGAVVAVFVVAAAPGGGGGGMTKCAYFFTLRTNVFSFILPQMSLRLFERLPLDLPPRPLVTAEKTYLFSDNQLMVQARLDAGVYAENDVVQVSVVVQRPRGHGAR